MKRDCPVVHFDHHSAEFAADPWSVYRDLRSRCPVAYSAAYDGFWVITRYEDIRAIALDDVTFSSADSILIPPKLSGQRSVPIEVDPPMFQEYRRLLQPWFSPAAVDRLEPAIERYVHECIDAFIAEGRCDLIHDLADPLPAMTTLHLLGLPIDDWRRYAETMHATVFLREDNPKRIEALGGLKWIREEVGRVISERREAPGDDLVSHLVTAEVVGRPVEDQEVLEMVQLVIGGGLDTTGSAISNSLLYLDDHPEDREPLRTDRNRLLPVAIEEFLRYEAPQQALARTATRDVEVGGQQIRAGDKLLLVWASGNRDEDMFDPAEEVVIDRFPNRHMTFGLGAHRCLGSNLARRQIRLALEAVLDRLPDYAIDRDRVERAETIGVAYGYFSMPATFTPGERRRAAESSEHE